MVVKSDQTIFLTCSQIRYVGVLKSSQRILKVGQEGFARHADVLYQQPCEGRKSGVKGEEYSDHEKR